MTKYEVLTQLNQNQLQPSHAYQMLFAQPKERKPHRAHFIKLKIRVPESKAATVFLAVLFALPIHIGLVKLFLSRKMEQIVSDQLALTYREVIDLVAIKGVVVDIKTSDHVRVYIKTI